MSATMVPPTPPVTSVATAEFRPERRVAETGIWIAIATISMSFAALTSALVVRQSSAPDWQHFQLPPLLYVNTLVLLVSSVTLESSRRRPGSFGLHATLILGILFLVRQGLPWRQLAAQNMLLEARTSSALFSVLSPLHPSHL